MPPLPHQCEIGCRDCSVRNSVLFAGLPPLLLESIQGNIEEINLRQGESLYRMGDPAAAAFTLRSGLIKLVQYLPDGGVRIVRLVRDCDVLGLEALLGHRYQHDAVVLQDASLCRLPTSLLSQLVREHPELHQELLRRFQRALTDADRWLTELSTGSARQRVIRLLLQLVNEKGEGLCILFGRKDMGAMLGVTTESASRTVAELKREGLLEESAGEFRCNLVALRRLASD